MFEAGSVALGSNTLALRHGIGDMHIKGKITGNGRLIIGGPVFLYPAGSDYSGGTTIESTGFLAGFPTSIRGNVTVSPGGVVRFTDFLGSDIDNNANKNGIFRGSISGGGTIYIVGARIGFDPADSTSIGADIYLGVTNSPGTLAAAAPGSLNFGALRLTASTATLDMGTGANAVSFANSSDLKYGWVPGTIRITNYVLGSDSLRFGTSSTSLKDYQLQQLVFTDYGNVAGQIDSNGFVTPATSTPTPSPTPPVITSPLAVSTTATQPFTYQVIASNNPTSYSAANLPAGLTFDGSLGVISGTLTTAATYKVFIGAANSAGTGSAMLTITVQPAPPAGSPVIVSASITGRTGQLFGYQVIATAVTSAATISASGLPAGLTIDTASGFISGIPQTDGSYEVSLTLNDGNAMATGSLELTFTSDTAFPAITSPSTVNVTPNQPFRYTITAPSSADPSSDPTTYSYSGTLPNGLSFDPSTGTISGTYSGTSVARKASASPDALPTTAGSNVTTIQLFAHNSHGTASTTLTFLTSGLVANVATRLPVGTNDNVLIQGFIVQGPAGSTKKIIVRAIGPSLAQFGITDALPNPTLEIHDASNATVATNNDWKTTQVGGLITGDQLAEINASQLAPSDDLESAIIANLAPGSYTAVVRGSGNSTGTGIVDAYDISAASPARL